MVTQLLGENAWRTSQEQHQESENIHIAHGDIIYDEQDAAIVYYFGQEMLGTNVDLEAYKQIVNNVNKEQILNIANKVKVNTIYFLRN